jgi:hypothetical protein
LTGHNPQLVGEALLDLRKRYPKRPFSELADMVPQNLPSVPSESWGSITTGAYLAELQAKANNGDVYAASMLEHLLHGVPLADDPSGN